MWQPEEHLSEGLLKIGDKARIHDLSVSAEWDPCDRAGRLDIRAAVQDDRDPAADRIFVRAVVEAPDGEVLTAGCSRLIAEATFTAGTLRPIHLCRPIRSPVLWNAQAPRWYRLLLILEDSHGDVLDIKAGLFGVVRPGPCDIKIPGIRAGAQGLLCRISLVRCGGPQACRG